MTLSLIKYENVINNLFKRFPGEINKTKAFSENDYLRTKAIIINFYQIPTYDHQNKIKPNLHNALKSTASNIDTELHLLALIIFKSDTLEDHTIRPFFFKAIQQLIDEGMNVNNAMLVKIQRANSPAANFSYYSALDLAITQKRPNFSLIINIIFHGGLCLSLEKIDAIGVITPALDHFFNRVKPLFIGHTDNRSILHILSQDVLSVLIRTQLWHEARIHN